MWAPFKKLANKQKGFTIIEVMIVLAIAGLIIAIVLLAVPALQRGQRNNGRTNDATHIAGIVGDYEGNHAGVAPPAGNCTPTLYGAAERFSQLTTCTVVAGATTGVSTTTAIVATAMSCVNGTPAASAGTPNAFIVAWNPETTGTAYTTCVSGGA